jgi:hypothetical protein
MSIERRDFSERLQQTLHKRGYDPDSPTKLAREFNSRYDGRPVTVHAVRKWLLGEAIPVQDKLRTLAAWLTVDVTWLRFGDEPQAGTQGAQGNGGFATPDLQLIAELRLLDPHHRHIAREIVRALLHLNGKNPAPAHL